MTSPDKNLDLLTALSGALPTTATAPLSVQGILNIPVLSSTPVRVLLASTNGLYRRVKIVVVTAAVNVGWVPVVNGSATPTITAAGAGGANDASLIVGGSGATEFLVLSSNQELWMVSSANCVAQITVFEQ